MALTEPAVAAGGAGLFRVGTLRYTRAGLVSVFFWLLWGDFVWTVMEAVLPSVMPYLLKDLGASNETIQLLNKSLAYMVSFVLSPMVSFHSDRHRGRWGRRMPYLLWSTPFVSMFLVLLGFYKDIGRWVAAWGWHLPPLSEPGVYLTVIAVLIVAFDIANMFVSNIYYYLFNDVVPEQFLSRFLALFRMVGTLGGAAFSYWVFPLMFDAHQLIREDHFKLVTVTAGVLYLAGFMVMCFRVKEGRYPPPPEHVDKRKGLISSLKTFAQECFTHRFYWYFFLSNTCLFVSWQSGTFIGLRNRDSLGIDIKEIGWMAALTQLASFVIYYPAGYLADKFSPVRMYLIFLVLTLVGPLAQSVWIFADFGHDRNLFWQVVLSLAILPIGAMRGTVELPMYMRLLPKERYGQFCSANEMIRSFVMAGGAWLSGWMMDVLMKGSTFLGVPALGNWAYRYYSVWVVFWEVLSVIFFWLLYREWKRRGGAKGYVPPAA